MIPSPNAYFTAEEARKTGAKPIAFFTVFPFYHQTGIASGSGTFQDCAFVSPDKILSNYYGYDDGYWYSPAMATGLGKYPSPAVTSCTFNHPGYDQSLKFRSAPTLAQLAAASWETITSGDTVYLYAYYQWGVFWAGYRCWTKDVGDPGNDFSAYAVDDPGDPLVSYAGPTEVYFDSETYIYGALFTGEFTFPHSDVKGAGQLTIEAPMVPGEMVAGDHTLVLNNRHRANGVLAPRYSPHKSSFLFAGETDWYRRKMRIEFGYVRPGTGGKVFDLLNPYEGEIRSWGPAARSTESSHVVEIYSKDRIAQALERKIGLPDADGNPHPLFFGEYLAKAEQISGKGIGEPLKTVDFERGNFDKLLSTATVNGGILSLNSTTPLKGSYSLRAEVTGAGQAAYGITGLGRTTGILVDELLLQFPWRFTVMPSSPVYDNLTCFVVRNAADATLARFFVSDTGKLACISGAITKETDWSIATHENIRAEITLWVKCGNPGNISLWVSGDQVLEWDDVNLAGSQVKDVILGLGLGSTAESWTIDLDDIRHWDVYYANAYQVFGYPFTEIKSIYKEMMLYSASTVDKYPELGLVNFTEAEAVTGEVLLRVAKNTVTHPVDINQGIWAAVGLEDYIDTASYAAAKAALPDDRVGCRFENMTAGEALAALNSRCLLNNHVEQGEVKLLPYLGTPPASAALSIDDSELREMLPKFDMENSRLGVIAKWGWYDRNPDLIYTAGDASEGQVEEIDFTINSPVFTESAAMATQKADWLFSRLRYGQEIIEPARVSLRGARLEMGDGVEITDPHMLDAARIYEVMQKIINLEPPFQTELRLGRFLGES